jgi:predicted nucleotidyltransferase
MEERLKTLLQALQGYHPQRVILFGSTARGDADADSDLDVLVVKDTEDRLCTASKPWRPCVHLVCMPTSWCIPPRNSG